MKKAFLIFASLGFAFHAIAQEKVVGSALTDLAHGKIDEAKQEIDQAMGNPETKDKPKALLAKVQIYNQLQNTDKYKASSPYREATSAAFHIVEVKPDYEKATVDQSLLIGAYLYFNDGVRANNDKKSTEAVEYMQMVIKIHDLDGGKRLAKITGGGPRFDTIAAQAYLTIANIAYYSASREGGNFDEAIPKLIQVKNNPITRSPNEYECLIDAYNRQKNSTEALATIQEARKFYPDDVTLRNYELNYFITSGKQDEILKKLEDASAKDPSNPDILFNIATTYLGMAHPKDKSIPANSTELYAKAEDAFTRTIKIAPENPAYNYNFGAMYYNQATDVNEQMNAITGTSDADQKKYDALKTQRDGLFAKSMPYFEKAYSVYSAKENALKDEDRKTYKSTLVALQQIYSRQSKLDKAAEMKKKYESL